MMKKPTLNTTDQLNNTITSLKAQVSDLQQQLFTSNSMVRYMENGVRNILKSNEIKLKELN